MKLIIGLLIILVLLFLHYVSEIAFKRIFLRHRKNKEDAFLYLEDKGILDREIYEEENIEEVEIKSKEGYTLKGYLIEKYPSSNKYIILVHGYSANHHIHMPFVRLFLNEGYNVLLVDQRGHGDSEGTYPTYGYFEKDDINRWIGFLVKRKGEEVFIGLHGQSLGGATALMCGAENEKVRFIIDDCGYSSGREVVRHEFSKKKFIPFWIVYLVLRLKIRYRCGFDMDRVNPLEDIREIDKPILFIHGEMDKVVPSSMGEDMYKSRGNKNDMILLVKEAGHMECYGKRRKEYEEIVHRFLESIS